MSGGLTSKAGGAQTARESRRWGEGSHGGSWPQPMPVSSRGWKAVGTKNTCSAHTLGGQYCLQDCTGNYFNSFLHSQNEDDNNNTYLSVVRTISDNTNKVLLKTVSGPANVMASFSNPEIFF